jgi:hypothetical protein
MNLYQVRVLLRTPEKENTLIDVDIREYYVTAQNLAELEWLFLTKCIEPTYIVTKILEVKRIENFLSRSSFVSKEDV